MSCYLIDRIEATPNMELLTHTELIALAGPARGRLERVRWRHNPTGNETGKQIRNVFVFIGADPATEWLRDCGVLLDRNGFVRTGPSLAPHEIAKNARPPMPLESNMFGIFAVGDVRCGSVKRIGGAIGEGAAVVPQLHAFLIGAPPASECGPRGSRR